MTRTRTRTLLHSAVGAVAVLAAISTGTGISAAAQMPGAASLQAGATNQSAPAITSGTPSAPIDFGTVVNVALSKIDAPYAEGGTGPNVFDGPGLVKYAYKQAGVPLPDTALAQAAAGTPVAAPNLRPGDVVSLSGYAGQRNPDLYGIYTGDGELVLTGNANLNPRGTARM
ncbi:NlpC/P60 family protein, partial [Rhodococcus erythropolis]|uniref:C40 family peptidase n=1 Tax=Rhodococcus erythropolis TaxID=1833 RepID=UPI0029497470